MRAKPNDMTPVVELTREKGTGPRRTRRPIYVDLLPPCNNACPAGENIQAWLALAQAGKYRDAWEVLVRDNPMPAVHGRVCYHPCESTCNRKDLDAAVSIHAVERFLGDLASTENWAFKIEVPPSGKRVLVVGAGPSGLSAAYHLARLGHTVEIHEAGPLPGGMMQFRHSGLSASARGTDEGDPRASRRWASRSSSTTRSRMSSQKNRQDGSMPFSSPSAPMSASMSTSPPAMRCECSTPSRSCAMSKTGEPPRLGRRVVIYGGGNTAMDAARTARRLGADEALIVYRRDRAHMPAHAFEADEALEEGVKIKWLTSIKDDRRIGRSRSKMMELDAQGRPQTDRAVRDPLRRTRSCWRSARKRTAAFSEKFRASNFKPDGTVIVGPT